jgi:hypothetical protein
MLEDTARVSRTSVPSPAFPLGLPSSTLPATTTPFRHDACKQRARVRKAIREQKHTHARTHTHTRTRTHNVPPPQPFTSTSQLLLPTPIANIPLPAPSTQHQLRPMTFKISLPSPSFTPLCTKRSHAIALERSRAFALERSHAIALERSRAFALGRSHAIALPVSIMGGPTSTHCGPKCGRAWPHLPP